MNVQQIMEQLSTMIVSYGGKIATALVLLFFGWVLAGWASRAAQTALDRAKVDITLGRFIARLARWGILMLTFLACLSIFGVETTSFAAVLGSAGIAIGLAFQGTLSNFAAGMMLLLFRPFRVGDVIDISGKLGSVFAIELFSTTLDTFDNRRIIVPNGQVFGSTIENITHHPRRRADVDVGVDYSADIDKTREVLIQAAASVEGGLTEPAPAIVLLELGDSAVNWSVRVWATKETFGDVKQATIRAVKNHLDAAGIGIPFPQMDIHVDRTDAA